MRAIETEYGGFLFRSRLEARWAYAFDLLGIKFEYEKEGYHLFTADYLPDFWLPDLDVWVEIKGQNASEHEMQLAQELSAYTQKYVHIFDAGNIPNMKEDCYGIMFGPDFSDEPYMLCECPDCGLIGIEFEGRSDRLPCKQRQAYSQEGCPTHSWNRDKWQTPDSKRIITAFDMARKARFEHRQTPSRHQLPFQYVRIPSTDEMEYEHAIRTQMSTPYPQVAEKWVEPPF